MTSFCVQGRRGGQKGPKICVHTNSILPKLDLFYTIKVIGKNNIYRVYETPQTFQEMHFPLMVPPKCVDKINAKVVAC